jgi:hypothetical protein
MVDRTSLSMKDEKIHLIAGLTNIEHILTNQSFPYYMHCTEKRELLTQPEQQRRGRRELP